MIVGLFARAKNDGGVFGIARRAKRYYQNMDNSLKPKRSKKGKKGVYIYIFNILFFFFFLADFFLSLLLLLNAAAARNPLFFLGFFISSQYKST